MSLSIIDSVLILILVLIHLRFLLLNDIQSIIDSSLILWHNDIKYIKHKPGKGVYVNCKNDRNNH